MRANNYSPGMHKVNFDTPSLSLLSEMTIYQFDNSGFAAIASLGI